MGTCPRRCVEPRCRQAGGVNHLAEPESIQVCVPDPDVETHGLTHEFLQRGLLLSAFDVFDTVTRSGQAIVNVKVLLQMGLFPAVFNHVVRQDS